MLSAVARDASTGAAHFACASDGTLAFVPGSSRGEQRQLTWFDDSGRQQPVPLPAGPFQEPRISPDGKRAALLHGTAGSGDVWIYEFESGNFSRLTFTATNAAPMWDASGSFVYYSAFQPDGAPRRCGRSARMAEAMPSRWARRPAARTSSGCHPTNAA